MAKREKLIELIKKLRVMAEKGTTYEKTSAQDKLDNICVKYGINIEELFHPKPRKKRVFKLSSFTDEKDILVHCLLDSFAEAEITGNESLRQIHVKLTDSEYQEVLSKFTHYWALYLKERDALLSAFIIKNDIGIINSETTESEVEQDIESILDYLNIVKEENYASVNRVRLN